MIGRVLTLNGNPNPGPVPFEIALTLTTRFRCSQDEVQVRAALGIDRIRVDESTGPEYVNRKSCMRRYQKNRSKQSLSTGEKS